MNTRSLHIRNYQPGDEVALCNVYRSAVRQLASRYYSAEQILAWAPDHIDETMWRERIARIQPFVLEDQGEIVAYADLQANGYIDHFFVSGARGGQGLGGRLMRHLLQMAAERQLREMSADVSRAAQGFFEHFGFEVVEQRQPVLRGVVLPNALMRKQL